MADCAVVCQDVVEWAAEYDGEPFHALLTDCPYEISFMSKSWDASGVSFNPDTWRALAQHLYPGAFLFVFAGTINDDLISVAMRKAGLRKFHKCLNYAYGSGFPKATRIDTQVDKRKGGPGITLEVVKYLRECRDKAGISNRAIDTAFGFNGMAGHWCGFSQPEIPRLEHWPKLKKMLGLDDRFDEAIEAHEREVIGQSNNKIHLANLGQAGYKDEWDITAPATPLAQQWAGHRYGLQAIKPAAETILVFQKPYEGKPVDSITETGAGALWIDGARIAGVTRDPRKADGSLGGRSFHGYDNDGRPREYDFTQGRWPANLTLTHHPECVQVGTRKIENSLTIEYSEEEIPAWDCHELCAVRALGEQSGETSYTGPRKNNRVAYGTGPALGFQVKNHGQEHNDRGTAARFFYNASWTYEQLEQSAPVYYTAKASAERHPGLDDFYWRKDDEAPIDFVRITREEWEQLPEKERAQGNIHSTVKPIKLTKYLATLLLPPDAYAPRRLLCPFAGSGSEMIGAMLAGWEHIVGVELVDEYAEIAEARLAWWEQAAAGTMFNDVKQILKGARENR